jgi:hypothetical protein
MRKVFRLPVLAILLLILGIFLTFPDDPEADNSYSVLEVELFQVDREDVSTKKAERAGMIPDEMLINIQRGMIGELTREKAFPSIRKPEDTKKEAGDVLIIGGRIIDFKAGSKTARIMIGFGAGGQKIEAECVLKDKKTGEIIGKQRIVDRKVAGWAGGSETKGIHDFAEKIHAFIKKTLKKQSPK